MRTPKVGCPNNGRGGLQEQRLAAATAGDVPTASDVRLALPTHGGCPRSARWHQQQLAAATAGDGAATSTLPQHTIDMPWTVR